MLTVKAVWLVSVFSRTIRGTSNSSRRVARHGKTDQTSRIDCHKVDQIWSRKLSGTDHISFVFPIFIIDDDDRFSCLQIRQGILNGIKRKRLIRKGLSVDRKVQSGNTVKFFEAGLSLIVIL